MKTYYHRIVFALCLLMLAGQTYATNYKGIGLTFISYSLDSTNCSRSDSSGGGPGGPGQLLTLSISARITNFDSVPYIGPVDLGLYDSDSLFIHTQATLLMNGIAGNQLNLDANEGIAVNILINIPTMFRPGPDVVVVWPMTLRPVADSIIANIELPGIRTEQLSNNTTGITNTQNSSFSYIVSQDKIELVNLSAGLNFKQVRIFSMNGQLVMHENSDNITEINLPNLPVGIYNCELLSADNNRRVIRFVH